MKNHKTEVREIILDPYQTFCPTIGFWKAEMFVSNKGENATQDGLNTDY